MPRSVPEWIGKTPDTPVPPRVRDRNFLAHDKICHVCKCPIRIGDLWDTDHVIRVKDGGPNRESNLAPAHERCHSDKTTKENKQQAIEDRKRKKHLGIKPRKRKMGYRKFNGEIVPPRWE